ncbi:MULTISPECIES: hypothetical protein [unclassified Methylophaga]|uniref:hypothetical protein n=1 Tax=unclassified Methylophaga TaxID=2629249 RepID=UPI000C36F139|nr:MULTISPECIES: hypothetical protein [unclassified Methylophaga]MAL49945.1 hypothetical protein [Methylophaga sp.]MAM28682.1 hypothetical protein [Flavobacteriaceae bacterium]MBP24821.1 hypothetical protein [Methylophaga sp.]HCC80937.1 hypothetical protein [Methylophaga sp.]
MEPIKIYVELLSQVAKDVHPLKKYFENENTGSEECHKEAALIRIMAEDGLINLEDDKVNTNNKITITPKGALALFEWKDGLQKKSFLHRLQEASFNLFWLVVGAVLTFLVRLNS